MQVWLGFGAQLAPLSQDATYHRLGKYFSNKPLSISEKERLAPLIGNVHPFRVGQCYMNAGKLVLARKALKFCEGVAGGPWPMAHAWVSFEGRAIDVTWPLSWKNGRSQKSARFPGTLSAEIIMRRVEHNIANCTYKGIEIETPIIKKHFFAHRRYGPMFDPDHARAWPDFERQIFGTQIIKETRVLAGVL